MADLSDTWTTRDFPLLVEIARLIEQQGNAHPANFPNWEDGGTEERRLVAGFKALEAAGYLELGNPRFSNGLAMVHNISMEARQLVGLWPSAADGSDALVQALLAAANATSDAAEKTKLRTVAEQVGGISASVMSSVASAWIASRIGA
jgi:hypothetical protein